MFERAILRLFPILQVLLLVDNPDHLEDDQMAPMEGLRLSGIAGDSGLAESVPTDLVLSIGMRCANFVKIAAPRPDVLW